eukprot:COSAG02_NODE_1737_length_11150_cov_15.164420_2_plen_185_part_00
MREMKNGGEGEISFSEFAEWWTAGAIPEEGDTGGLSDKIGKLCEIKSEAELEGDVREWAKFSEIDAILAAIAGFLWPSLEVINVGSGKPPAPLDKEGQAAVAAKEAQSRNSGLAGKLKEKTVGKMTTHSNPLGTMDDDVETPAEVSDVETRADEPLVVEASKAHTENVAHQVSITHGNPNPTSY